VALASEDLDAFVRTSAWGRSLGTKDLDLVLDSARSTWFKDGEYLVRAGDPATHWIGLIEGLAVQQVTSPDGNHTVLTAAFTGVWFGEGTLMRHARWQYDAVARRQTHAAFIPIETFHWLMDTSLAFNRFIAHLLNARLSHYMGLLANERLTSVEARMAHMLASLYDPHLYPNRPALLRIGQADLALLSGMSRQRANAALQRLEAKGLIERQRVGVTVLDLKGLADY
jgi:CRP-like cAMP-binding protein